jgi:hypothetical protein
MTRTTKISTVQKLTAAPDWKRRFFIGPDSWCETQKETHHDKNTHCIHPRSTGQPGPPPLEQQRHLLVPLHTSFPRLHEAPRSPKPSRLSSLAFQVDSCGMAVTKIDHAFVPAFNRFHFSILDAESRIKVSNLS